MDQARRDLNTPVRDALEKLSKVFTEQPMKARSKNPPATATLNGGLNTATVIAVRAAQVGVSLTLLEVSVTSESDTRGLIGADDRVSAGLAGLRTHVKIGAEGTTPDQLQEIVRWGDAHSPVGCTIRDAPANTVEIEIA